ncbi:TPA: hypothetical protein ACOFBV_001268 [Stenotrophomonas maltophilia]|uniref:hypothetical protein n=1 Tax=Stenotrophomonas maltophilia TaxID=40324 RepID=UPI0039C31632
MKASNLVLAKDVDLKPGTFFHSGTGWHLRLLLEDSTQKYEASIGLTGDDLGEFNFLDQPSSCMALLPRVKLQARVAGDISGPAAPPPGSLVWGRTDISIATGEAGAKFVLLSGTEADDVLPTKCFYATEWGLWEVDDLGNAIHSEPLLIVKAK